MASRIETDLKELIDLQNNIRQKDLELARHAATQPDKPTDRLTIEYLEKFELWDDKNAALEEELDDLQLRAEIIADDLCDVLDTHRDLDLIIQHNDAKYIITVKTTTNSAFKVPQWRDTALHISKAS